MAATYSISSPTTGSAAAIAIVEVRGAEGEVAGVLMRLVGEAGSVAIGRCGLREVSGVDTMVIARPEAGLALVFAHAGRAVLTRVIAALQRAGAVASAGDSGSLDADDDPSRFAARLHSALARAASPLAIDLLLAQPRRWERVWAAGTGGTELPPESSSVLRRLIDPPVVVAIGPPNVGKSSLLNAIAGRAVSVVADEPGTTRDHVGVSVDFAGVVARFIDAPGITIGAGSAGPSRNDDTIQRESQRIALEVAAGADLILWCGDLASGFVPMDAQEAGPIAGRPGLRVGLRSDLGVPTGEGGAARQNVSARTGEGLESLVAAVREALVPAALMADKRAWRFWQAEGLET